MKALNFIILIFFSLNYLKPVSAQQQFYPNGDDFTPKGHMHCLIVFVTYLDAANNSLILDDDGIPLTNPYFTSNDIPDFALLDGLIDELPSDINTTDFNLSSYFHTASFGTFTLTGKIVNVESNNLSESHTSLAQKGYDLISSSDYHKFNLRDLSNNSFSFDNSGSPPDSIGLFDYIAVIRKEDNYSGATGYNNQISECGHWQKSGNGKNWLMQTFIHEFAHQMYSAAHVAGSNNVFQNHFNLQEGWGMTTLPIDNFFLPRANEMWVNGWLRDNPQDSLNRDIITVNTNTINTHTGGIQLGDLLSTRKAVRIEIPNSNPLFMDREPPKRKKSAICF